jgi:hypothetical protein
MDHLHKHGPYENGALEHHHTVLSEILCHLPYAIFAVALSMIVMSLLGFGGTGEAFQVGCHGLFHNFHFFHVLFAATGTMLTFRRYSNNVWLGIIVGFFVPILFCTFSDALLPYLGGRLLGLDMKLHWCLFSHLDTIIPFVLIGMLNGWAMSTHQQSLQMFYSLGFHVFHVFLSSMASLLYLVGYGFGDWSSLLGFVFMFKIIAVLIPCTLSDIVVPMFFARLKKSPHA